MHPDTGLRTFCSASEIAFFEYSNIISSEGMKNVIFGIKDGITDFELSKKFEYNGIPLNCHVTMKSGSNRNIGLSGPTGGQIKRGDSFSTNFGYWGSNICRAGWIAENKYDLPLLAQDYVENFAAQYFEVMAEWFALLKIGTKGVDLERLISEKLPFDKFGIFLNAGHLIHLDEWLSSPIYKNSKIKLHSGMYMQVDVIPSSAVYYSTRMEDGVIIADKVLQQQIKEQYPDCYNRCFKRREFIINTLGIDLPEEILPLSNIPAIVPPFLLNPNSIFAI